MENLDLSGEYTGRYLMIGKPGSSAASIKEIKSSTGLNLTSSTDFENEEVSNDALDDGDGIFFDKIGIAVINAADAAQLQSLSAMSIRSLDSDTGDQEPIIEPERVCRVIGSTFDDYLTGYKDAVEHLSEKYFAGEEKHGLSSDGHGAGGESVSATWGLQMTKVVVNFPYLQTYTGAGIKVVVLDTGLDLNHPDFAGRTIVSKSFVPGEAVQDLHSHGTHCIGTACGPLNPTDPSQPRYGIAYQSHIYAGKVLNNAGSGADGWILAGINWAIANNCQVISMSLGATVESAGYSVAYENAAKAALNAGCLIVAAAGNDTNRPVSHPANCPSIMAVGAVDSNMVKASFSNITFYPPHGKVDIAGPGVGTLSSVPLPTKYGTKSGTSMATPHVAGIAALFAQKDASYRGSALWAKLSSKALALPQPSTHVGSGLVQAPYKNGLFKPVIPPIVIRKPKPPMIPIPKPEPKLPISAKKNSGHKN